MSEKHLSVRDLAERLGLSADAVYAMNSRGTGPRYFKTSRARGATVRYRLADVEAWERAHMVGGSDAA